MKLLVLGASCGCGQWLVRLADERGHHVRALVRPTTPSDPPSGAEVEVLRGDVLTPSVLDRALNGCDAVLSALGIKRKAPWNPWSTLASPPNLTTQVTQHLVAAMLQHDIYRIVAISAAGVGDSLAEVHPLIQLMINYSNMAASYADLEGMENTLSASTLDWMAVRPTTLRDGPPTGNVHLFDHYGLFTRITRGDVAAWMLNAVEQPTPFTRRTPMIGG